MSRHFWSHSAFPTRCSNHGWHSFQTNMKRWWLINENGVLKMVYWHGGMHTYLWIVYDVCEIVLKNNIGLFAREGSFFTWFLIIDQFPLLTCIPLQVHSRDNLTWIENRGEEHSSSPWIYIKLFEWRFRLHLGHVIYLFFHCYVQK